MKTLPFVESKIFDKRFPWEEIDKEKALQNTHVLDALREACLVESYFALYTGKMLQLFWYDVDATSIFTIEAFEAYTHYYTLRRYLETINYKPIKDEEVKALRKKDKDQEHEDEIRELINFGMTEHFAAQFFNDLSELTEEPVLKAILTRFSQEEVTHAEFAYDLIEKRIASDPTAKKRVLEYASNFQHVGAYVLPHVSNAKEDNLRTIQRFNERIEKLAGQRLSDYLMTKEKK